MMKSRLSCVCAPLREEIYPELIIFQLFLVEEKIISLSHTMELSEL